MSRTKARKPGVEKTSKELEARGIYVRSASWSGLRKRVSLQNIDDVIEAAELAGISKGLLGLLRLGTSRDNLCRYAAHSSYGTTRKRKDSAASHLDTVPRKSPF